MSAHDTARLVANAPEPWWRELRMAADPQLDSDYRSVAAKAARIRRLSVTRAVAVVEACDDLALLGAIARNDTRPGVSSAVHSHPLYMRVPHHLRCKTCVDIVDGIDDLATFVEYPRRNADCDYGVARRILLTADADIRRDAWDALVPVLYAVAAAAIVELDSGREQLGPVATEWIATKTTTWQHHRYMLSILMTEPHYTDAMLERFANISSSNLKLPLTRENLLYIINNCYTDQIKASNVVVIAYYAGTLSGDDVRNVWHHLTPANQAALLARTPDRALAEFCIDNLHPNLAANCSRDGHEAILNVLHMHPDLDSGRRVKLLSGAGASWLPRFANGLLGSPRPGEVRAAAEAICTTDPRHRLRLPAELRRITTNPTTPGVVELITYLIDTSPATSLLAGDDFVAEAAHKALWGNLETAAARTVALGLLNGWTGNIADLVQTANLLGG